MREEESLHLFTLGPSCHALCKCDSSGMGRSYPPCLSKAIIASGGISMETLVGLKYNDLDTIRVSVMCGRSITGGNWSTP